MYNDSREYLNNSIRAYVNANSTLDKFFAFKLIVISMVIAVDALIEHIEGMPDTPFLNYYEESSFFLPLVAYEQRINDLIFIEEKGMISPDYEFSRRFRKALDSLKVASGLRSLLALNIKEYINEAQFFISDIQRIVEKKEIIRQG
ncbi:MAG: hypothetical protein ACTSPV_13790 [Candidatus Hodarchaeales archaeon]